MVIIISSFLDDQILKENLTKYFDDEIDHKLIEDFAGKVHARAMQYSKTGMLHLNLIPSYSIDRPKMTFWEIVWFY